MLGTGSTQIAFGATLAMTVSNGYLSLVRRSLVIDGTATYTPDSVNGYSLAIGTDCTNADTVLPKNGTVTYAGTDGTDFGSSESVS